MIYCLTRIVLDKFRGGRGLVPGRELVHHHYCSATHVRRLPKFVTCLKKKMLRAVNIDTETNGTNTNNDEVQLYQERLL